MRKVQLDKVELGQRLAKTIFNSDGGVLLSEGLELKESYIDKLRTHGISELYLEDDISSGVVVQDVVYESTRNEAVILVKSMMSNYVFSSVLGIEEIKVTVNIIVDELLLSEDILVNLSEIKLVDDYTFEHSVNVCILSLIMGIGLGFDITKLKELGVGAILHDVGKLMIPNEILKKPSQLTVSEFETIKKHTVYGYEMLKASGKVNLISAYIAFGHHERYDGSGYPLQLKSNNIQQCARIAAVADVYDALTSDRVYRKKLKPNEVFEYITSLGAHHFDPKVVESFVKYVSIYPVGTGVILNSRERALVIKANRCFPTRPLVRVIYDDRQRKLIHFKEIDLSGVNSLFIVDGCDL